MFTIRRLITYACAFVVILGPHAVGADDLAEQEAQIGRQVHAQLEQKGEILTNSPYYAVLDPIARQIKSVADARYNGPFTFILVHEKQPNAFAVPGGNVYVTDSLMRFVENREELAGVLCHETAHDIHHDVVHNLAKERRVQRAVGIGALITNIATGGQYAPIVNGLAQFDLLKESTHFSREVETAADLTGAEICAQAGSNPWGMVWLFGKFDTAGEGAKVEMLSDHPTNQHRITDLQRHFRELPALFAPYSSDERSATPLERPQAPADEDGGRHSPN